METHHHTPDKGIRGIHSEQIGKPGVYRESNIPHILTIPGHQSVVSSYMSFLAQVSTSGDLASNLQSADSQCKLEHFIHSCDKKSGEACHCDTVTGCKLTAQYRWNNSHTHTHVARRQVMPVIVIRLQAVNQRLSTGGKLHTHTHTCGKKTGDACHCDTVTGCKSTAQYRWNTSHTHTHVASRQVMPVIVIRLQAVN